MSDDKLIAELLDASLTVDEKIRVAYAAGVRSGRDQTINHLHKSMQRVRFDQLAQMVSEAKRNEFAIPLNYGVNIA